MRQRVQRDSAPISGGGVTAGECGEPVGALVHDDAQHEPYPGTELFRWGVKGLVDGKAKVKQLADAGVNIIKLIDQDQMTMEEVRAVVDEAHKANLPVIAHAHRPEEIRRGLAAGVDDFEHTGLAAAPEYPEDVMTLLRERTARGAAGPFFWTPTIEGLSTTSTFATTRKSWTTRRGALVFPIRSPPISDARSSIPIGLRTSR